MKGVTSFRFLVGVGAVLSLHAVALSADRTTGSPLFRQMQATGKPALVIAGSANCVHCREMAHELATNPAVKPLVEQMFVVKVDTDSREWPLLRAEFKFDGTGIPAVFFVRADGELLYSRSGRPTELEAFLAKRLEEAGTVLDADTLGAMRKELTQLSRAIKREDWPLIIELVKKRSGSGSFAATALAFDQAAEELIEKARSDLSDAQAQLAEEETRVEGAMALMAASKRFEGYEPTATLVAPALETARQDDTTAELLKDAERLNQAAELESKRRRPDAAEIYRQLVTDRPDSLAAGYAEERLKVLE